MICFRDLLTFGLFCNRVISNETGKIQCQVCRLKVLHSRAVGMSENPGVPLLFGGNNLSPLVEIGLTDLPKPGGAM